MMGKFCINCGTEVTGKFCSNCGHPTEGESAAVPVVPQETLNGVSFDPVPIFAAHKGFTGRMTIAIEIGTLTNAKPKEIASFVDAHYKDSDFMKRVAEYQEPTEASPEEETPPLTCPACKSTNIEIERKGYGFGKGIAGVVLFGPLGALAGGIGYKDVKCLCRHCGNRFTPKIPKKK
ncbi:zinc ribbon domain-containing protein [Selenomonas sp. oral taxon 136]|uniref:zinc ribbon domain-containing protein n=1 Tax=Selenomonas sp. oral taxon 136 TaxID=713030 RepID=UPI000A598C82|nr:zinc ribbon domain-containing protein [Selenomonas sp. oral taxon 136]